MILKLIGILLCFSSIIMFGLHFNNEYLNNDKTIEKENNINNVNNINNEALFENHKANESIMYYKGLDNKYYMHINNNTHNIKKEISWREYEQNT